MTDASLYGFLAARRDDPTIRLLSDTAAQLRADADYVRRSDDIAAAAFLNSETPADLVSNALQQALSRIETQIDLDRRAAELDPRHAEIANLPSPVREAALKALQTRRWRPGGLGLKRLALLSGDGSQAELMRIEPGHGAPVHDHHADELTLVLTGGFHDGHARYGKGDVSLARPGFRHVPVADPDEVCFVLGVTYGPPKFFGLYGFLQRTIGFPWAPTAPPPG